MSNKILKPWWLGPVVNAPQGHVWRWRTRKSEAHLVKGFIGRLSVGLCGRRVRGDWRAFQVGGYSIKPCSDCAALLPEAGC